MELSNKGIQELKASIGELLKKFDIRSNQSDQELDKIDLDFEKHNKNKIDEDMDIEFDDFDYSELEKMFDSLMPGDGWLDAILGDDKVKL